MNGGIARNIFLFPAPASIILFNNELQDACSRAIGVNGEGNSRPVDRLFFSPRAVHSLPFSCTLYALLSSAKNAS